MVNVVEPSLRVESVDQKSETRNSNPETQTCIIEGISPLVLQNKILTDISNHLHRQVRLDLDGSS